MIYGRVIGNELRDVPPECLPVWGQRWAGYRTPQGPSPFSTRILSIDRMSEVGPILTSPTQFERTLAEEDEVVDTSSELSPVYSAFPLSPLTIRTDVTELTSQVETSSPLSVPPSSSHLHDSPKVGNPPPQNSRRPRTTSLSRREAEQVSIQYHGTETLLHPPTAHHDLSTRRGRGPFEQDSDPWDVEYTSAGVRVGLSPEGQSTMRPYSMAEWQFSDNVPTQFLGFPLQPNPPTHSFIAHPSRPFQANDQHGIITTTPPTFATFSSLSPSSPQRYVGIDTSWNHDTITPGIAYPRNLMIPQWSPIPPNHSFPGLQSPGPSSGSGVFYHFVSDQHENSHSEDLLGPFPCGDSYTLLSLEKPEGDQINE